MDYEGYYYISFGRKRITGTSSQGSGSFEMDWEEVNYHKFIHHVLQPLKLEIFGLIIQAHIVVLCSEKNALIFSPGQGVNLGMVLNRLFTKIFSIVQISYFG